MSKCEVSRGSHHSPTSKSILSYQNGSTSNTEVLNSNVVNKANKIMEKDLHQETEKIKRLELLDIYRKKLISDLIVDVFNNDLGQEAVNIESLKISDDRQGVIQNLAVQIAQLSDIERLLLYLKLPSTSRSPFDPLRQPLNPLGNRQEIQQTIVWIRTHLEEDQDISIPKQDVYEQYLKFCINACMKPLSTADFGKVMKQVYPGVRPRRLGTRGNSRYCYSGMRNTNKLLPPYLPSLLVSDDQVREEANNMNAKDEENSKKGEKPKRKWKPTSRCKLSCGSGNAVVASARKSELLKNTKRSKIETETSDDFEEDQQNNSGLVDNIDSSPTFIKTENGENSFQVFDDLNKLDSTLTKGLDLYLDNIAKVEGYSEELDVREKEIHSNDKNNVDFIRYSSSGSDNIGSPINNEELKQPPALLPVKWVPNSCKKSCLVKSLSGDEMSHKRPKVEAAKEVNSLNGILNESAVVHNVFNKISPLTGSKVKEILSIHNNAYLPFSSISEESLPHTTLDKRNGPKIPRRNSMSKLVGKRVYVPIQPKPSELSLAQVNLDIRFNSDKSMNAMNSCYLPHHGMKTEGNAGEECYLHGEESNSQEQEEEIVRYFQHVDEKKKRDENTRGLKMVYKSTTPALQTTSYTRSQSCFEMQDGFLSTNCTESQEMVDLTPRSQSSLEFSVFKNEALRSRHLSEVGKYNNDDRNCNLTTSGYYYMPGCVEKISQLRFLLEKSIPTDGTTSQQTRIKEEPTVDGLNVNEDYNLVEAKDLCLSSKVGNNFERLKCTNTNKLVSFKPEVKPQNCTPVQIPQSPNTRTKYFSFTPISPGPKTPSTPSASPFVSPRNTPIPRSRQNSSHSITTISMPNEQFIYPSCGKVMNPRITDDVKAENSDSQIKIQKPDTDAIFLSEEIRNQRPRSYSTTNFDKAQVRKNLLKMLNRNQQNKDTMVNNISEKALPGSSDSGFLSGSDALSTEISNFFQNGMDLKNDVQLQSNAFRSQSAPLRRMARNNSWIMPGISNQFIQFDQNTVNATPVPSEFCDFQANDGVLEPVTQLFTQPSDIVPPEMITDDTFVPATVSDFNEAEMKEISEAISKQSEENLNSISAQLFEDPTFQDDNNVESFNDSGTDVNYSSDYANNVCSFTDDVISENSEIFKREIFNDGSDNKKDPVITAFRPVLLSESFVDSQAPSIFGLKINEDNCSSDYLKTSTDEIIQSENILNDTDVFVPTNNSSHSFSDALNDSFNIQSKGFN